MDFKLVDTVRLQKFKDKLLSIINTNITTINNSISSEATARDAAISSAIATEVSNRNTAISSAIATEVSNRNTALSKKSDTGHTHSNATTSASGFMSAADKTKLDGIATGAGVQVNSDWNATSGFAQILNKPTLAKVATSGKYTDLSGTPTIPTIPTQVSAFQNDSGYLTSHQSLADYALKTEIPTYTAGQGIKIENGVISIVNNEIGNPTCFGYTLYGDYFLSDTITPKKNWDEARNMSENVTVQQNYTLGVQIKIVTAKTLSKAELETLTIEQRKINDNGRVWYWTSTPFHDSYAWSVYSSGDFTGYKIAGSIDEGGGARLGFKNPFI